MDGFRIRSCLFAALLAVLASCSIKEDRSGCPCLLTVDLSLALNVELTPPSWWERGLTIALFREDRCFRQASLWYEEAGPEWETQVEKAEIGVVGMLGWNAGAVSGLEIRYPEGCQSDALYVSSRTVPCYGETARTRLEMEKQFSNVTIEGLDTFSAQMQVTATCNGLNLMTRQALEGVFRFPLSCDSEGICRFRMPRQSSDDVRILLLDSEGHLDNAIPLGAYMTEIGYVWDAPSLSDVFIRIDFVTASISVTVDDWTQVIAFPYTL